MLHERGREKAGRDADMHCHILPGLDDGSRDLAETVRMLRIAASEGIRKIVATPHFNSSGRSAPPEKVRAVLEAVQETADRERIPIRLYAGNEIFYFADLPRYLREGRVLTLNGSRHVLIEFSPSVMFRTLQNAMDTVLGNGYQPVLAHVERYICVQKDAENAGILRDMGVELQVNAGSVTGKSGNAAKKLVQQLLGNGWVSYVGTDAHSSGRRSPEMRKCRDVLQRKYDPGYAAQILGKNAVRAFGLAD